MSPAASRQRCVLRVARTAADSMKGPEEKGHELVVGNPLPTRGKPLPKAEVEAEFVAQLLGKLVLRYMRSCGKEQNSRGLRL